MKRTWHLVSCFLALAIGMADLRADAQEDAFSVDSAVLQIVDVVDVPAKVAGPMKELMVVEGAMVVEDQVLARIDDSDIQIAVRESKIELQMVEARLKSNVDIDFAKKSKKVAAADLKRAEESNLKYAGVVSDREMDRLKLLVEQSSADLEKVRFEKSLLKLQAKLKLEAVAKNESEWARHQIRSPFSGQIVKVEKKKGEWVELAQPVFRIVGLERLRVEEYLPADFANQSIVGNRAVFSSSETSVSLQGMVSFVSPEVNPVNSTVLVWMEFENKQLKLRPGMKGQVKVLRSLGSQ